MIHFDRRTRLFIVLNSIFLTFLIIAEVTGSKLISFMGFTLTIGVIPFPITFLVTDILNEFYGKRSVRFTTWLGMVMILLVYAIIVIDINIPATVGSPIDDKSFETVFANSGLVIIGSIIAYVIGQLVDIHIFHYLRMKTNGKHIWLRATGSTIVSQFIDTFIVIFIAFGKYLPFGKLLDISTTNFVYKFFVAVALTPVIYAIHFFIEEYLRKEIEHEHHHPPKA